MLRMAQARSASMIGFMTWHWMASLSLAVSRMASANPLHRITRMSA